MQDFQRFLDEALDKITLTPVEDSPQSKDYDINRQVSDLVTAARKMSHLTQKQLAQLSGVSQANISKIENGNYHPGLSTLQRIADALGKRLVVCFEDPEE